LARSRLSLGEFYGDGAKLRFGALLKEMRNQSRPIKQRDLGLIGEPHLRAKFESMASRRRAFATSAPK
jgi:hypothetical protein